MEQMTERFEEQGWIDNKMTKAEELGRKAELTDDDLSYIMTMDHVEYNEYSRAKSKDRGYINHIRTTAENKDMDVKLNRAEIKLIMQSVSTNASIEADLREEILNKIRKSVGVS